MSLLYTWILVFLRSLGIVLFVPQMAGRSPPIMVRLGLAMAIATLLTGVVPSAAFPRTTWDIAASAGSEVVFGLLLGFIVQMVFSAVELAGRIASSEVGMSGAPGMGTPDVASEPLAGFLSAFSVVLFFLFGGHLSVLSAFARSFSLAPAGHPHLSPGSSEMLIIATGRVIELGLRMAAPFVALNFLVTLAFSVLSRAVPRLSVFVLSAPVRGMVGFGLFSSAGALVARYLYLELTDMPLKLLQYAAAK